MTNRVIKAGLISTIIFLFSCGQSQPEIASLYCAFEQVQLCSKDSCDTIPVFFESKKEYPVEFDLVSKTVNSDYSDEGSKMNIISVRDKEGSLYIYGETLNSRYNGKDLEWLLLLDKSSHQIVITTATSDQGAVLHGHCKK